jgi:uncharacterized protein HemX
MTENNKPEWFEITDADEKPELRKVSKSLPVSAVLAVALLLGVGAVTSQIQNETPASANSASAEQTPAADTSQTAKAVSTATAAVVGTTAATKLVNPSISKLPTGGGDDDDDDHGRDHGRDHDDDDDDDEEGDDD